MYSSSFDKVEVAAKTNICDIDILIEIFWYLPVQLHKVIYSTIKSTNLSIEALFDKIYEFCSNIIRSVIEYQDSSRYSDNIFVVI